MRITASWFGSARDPPNTSMWRDPRAKQAGSPQIVIPTTTSVLPCSGLSRCGLATLERGERQGATANLDSPCARQRLRCVGRDEETGFRIEQRNGRRKNNEPLWRGLTTKPPYKRGRFFWRTMIALMR